MREWNENKHTEENHIFKNPNLLIAYLRPLITDTKKVNSNVVEGTFKMESSGETKVVQMFDEEDNSKMYWIKADEYELWVKNIGEDKLHGKTKLDLTYVSGLYGPYKKDVSEMKNYYEVHYKIT